VQMAGEREPVAPVGAGSGEDQETRARSIAPKIERVATEPDGRVFHQEERRDPEVADTPVIEITQRPA